MAYQETTRYPYNAGFPEGIEGSLLWNSAYLAGMHRFLTFHGLKSYQWPDYYTQHHDSALDDLAQFFGADSFEDWRRSVAQRSETNPVTTFVGTSTVTQELPRSQKQAAVDFFGLGKTEFTVDDLRTPAIQRFITNPETPVRQLIDLFLKIKDAITDEFACYQLYRNLLPESFAIDLKQYHGTMEHPYGGLREGLSEFKFNWCFPSFWDSHFPDSEKLGLNTEENQYAILHKLAKVRIALMKLNDLILNDEDFNNFDWLNFPKLEVPEGMMATVWFEGNIDLIDSNLINPLREKYSSGWKSIHFNNFTTFVFTCLERAAQLYGWILQRSNPTNNTKFRICYSPTRTNARGEETATQLPTMEEIYQKAAEIGETI